MDELMSCLVLTHGALDAQTKKRTNINDQIFRISEQMQDLISRIRARLGCYDEYLVVSHNNRHYIIHEHRMTEISIP